MSGRTALALAVTAIAVAACDFGLEGRSPASTLAPLEGSSEAAPMWTPRQLDNCECADGSAPVFLEHRGDPTKVVLYFEGGGACWSGDTCGPDAVAAERYVSRSGITAANLAERGGYFDLANPDNPLAGYSWLYVPYCTGDLHLGNKSTSYGDGVQIEHRGFANGLNALVHLVATYPGMDQLVVTGTSAGSVPTPLFAGLAADLVPDADIVTFGDSSGAYPNSEPVTTWLNGVWGLEQAIPDWPETEGLTGPEWSIPRLYVYAGQHAPRIRFGRFDYAFDGIQASYEGLGGADDAVLALIDRNEAEIEASGVNIASYVAPGAIHTVIAGNAFYTTEVGGVRLVDWLRQLLAGPALPPDVHCEQCT